MALEGSLQVFNLPEILQMIALQQKTGILTVQGESDIVAISFLKGKVVAADALNQTVEERLGKVLASRGQVQPGDFAAVAAEHQTSGGRPMDLLVSKGYITRSQLLAALRSQTLELLVEVAQWKTGDFKFYSGEEVSYEEGFEAIAVQELIVGAISAPALPGARPAPRPVPPFGDASGVYEGLAPVPPPPLETGPRRAPAPPAHSPREREAQLGPGDGASERLRDRSERGERRERGDRGERVPLQTLSSLAADATDDLGHEPAPLVPGRWPLVTAVAVAATLVVTLILVPSRLSLPLAFQEEALATQARLQRTLLYQKLDSAARTYFLLEGHYPDELQRLVESGLLASGDLSDAEGRPLAYSTSGLAYTIQPVAGGEPLAELATSEAVTGDFLLDAEFLRSTARSPAQPLVLLD